MSEIDTTQEERDDLAGVVIARYRRARQYRDDYEVHQGISYSHMLERADHQYRREYTSQDAIEMETAFGFCPTRYLGICQQKVNATVAWMNDLVINNLDAMFTVTPSPKPTLDKASLDRIRRGVKRELVEKMQAGGIADPALLLDARGKPDVRIQDFLQQQVRALHKVEQSRIVALATDSAMEAQTRMRDVMVEGQFRQGYADYQLDRVLKGNGIVRFPDWQRRAVLVHSGKKAKMEWQTRPWFRAVKVDNFYPVCDAADYQTNSGNTEYTWVTKAELIGMANQDHYFRKEIEGILDDYEFRARSWLDGEFERDEEFWELDDTIPLLVHEGFFSGDELREYGIGGIESTDYVSARIEVCGLRTIRAQLLRMPGGADRSYFGSPFVKTGDNLLDRIGMGALLWDSEQRVNRLMHIFEHNVDWASRPARLINSSVFANPNDADNIVPGGQYDVEDRYATSGSMPEPVRNINAVSAQYHLIMTQVGAVLRQADEDCGIPAFAYGAQNYGQASLGEFSQRMSNALRTIKQAALNEDQFFIEPAFTGLFHYMMEKEENLAEGQDVNVLIRGMTGLLKEDEKRSREASVLQFVIQGGEKGLVPEQAVQYAVRRLLEQAGFPVDALGMTDPVTDIALAVAAAAPVNGSIPGGPQVPQLDGRSNVPAANVATPAGVSQASIPGVPQA